MKSYFQILIVFLISTNILKAQNFTALGDGVKTLGHVRTSAKDTANNITYIGGDFKSINGVAVSNVAMFDGTNWFALGTGIEGSIITMKMINGELYVAGYIQNAGGIPVNNIAKWNGSNWSSVGQGLPYVIREIEYFQNKIFITGFPPYTSTSYLASFDGTTWSSNLGSFDRSVNGMLVKNNDLMIYGNFQIFNTDSVDGFLSYNGSTFNYYPTSFELGVSSAILIDTTIYILSAFEDSISFFDGLDWQSYYAETGTGITITKLFSYHDSLYLVADSTSFTGGADYTLLRKLNSNLTTENILKIRRDNPNYLVDEVTTTNNEIDVVGLLDHIEDTFAISYFHYDGSQWTNPGKIAGESYYDAWINSNVNTIVKDNSTGDIFVGGRFFFAGTTYSPNVARWDGTSWHAMAGGLSSSVYKLIFFNNELYAFGNFGRAGSNYVGRVAKWNGNTWEAVGSGFSSTVLDAIVFNNELYACGNFTSVDGVSANYIAKYDGTNWSPVGNNLLDDRTQRIIVYNNQLIAAAEYIYFFQGIDPSSVAYLDSNDLWQMMDLNFIDGCNSMLVHNNQLFASSGNSGGVQVYQWDGIQFNQIGTAGAGFVNGELMEYKNNIYLTISNDGFYKYDSINFSFDGPLSSIQPYAILEDGTTDYFGGFFPYFYVGLNKVELNNIASFSPNLPLMSFSANTDTICERENVYYTVNSTDPFATYTWHFTGVTPDTLNYPNPIIQYLTPGNFSTYLVVENLFGTDTIHLNGNITVLPCLASTQEINKNAISAFPNPFTERIHINSDQLIDLISISEVSGKIIIQRKPDMNSIDLSDLNSGIYFMSCRTKNSISTFRIIKQ